MDSLTLDHVIAELEPFVRGRHLGRPHLGGPHSIAFEVSGDRDHWLWLEAAPGTAGLYRLPRTQARFLAQGAEDEAPGGARQALLLLRKHLGGVRLTALHRILGERTVVMDVGRALLVLRLSGVPALTLIVEGAALATVGAGPPAWPLPAAAGEREWDRVDPRLLAAAAATAAATGRSLPRALLSVCPGLGPLLARELDGQPESLAALRTRLASPRPTLLAPGPMATWHDADLAPPEAVALAPFPLEGHKRVALHPASWLEAASLFLLARSRGTRFERARKSALQEAGRKGRRLAQLEAHLLGDLQGLPEAARLRREAEALLASPGSFAPVAGKAEVPDPYAPDRHLLVAVDPTLSAPGNADRLFQKARRIEKARRQVETRLGETRVALEAERAREARLHEARDVADLEPPRGAEGGGGGRESGTTARPGSRHYLTARGFSLLVGRGAKENHHLTFHVARPEDVWLHARDVPGAQVILRDPEGRAGGEDFREAAEVAAFFSDARAAAQVDVHVTRRKHLRPARGGRGRVAIAHSETVRVAPRDPEGRLRRR
ncbi:MAG TPA: NFACT RNA binding domain-containing protein [Vicinamibacteria bacterium]|jgi:predicted ribosome quality control (RQC) complex YloA/Tae2 family protein|nr:NFACT RNA binding domain-containing protein [Vicinamibacteria bacterium]